MTVREYRNEADACVMIFNLLCENGDTLFKPITAERFEELFLDPSIGPAVFVGYESDRVIAFGAGNCAGETGYITYIGVLPEYRRRGYGKAIAETLEGSLAESHPEMKKIELVFYNPTELPWFIPGHAPHDHAGQPGVDMSTAAYPFYESLGYRAWTVQNTYYLPLSEYRTPDEMARRLESLRENGIGITYYDGSRHGGFSELFDNIGNEGWRRRVMARLDEDIVVAVKDGKVIGYTGPLSVSKEGRGLFCGIAVRTEYRHHGIGKALFAGLCKGLSEKGATFMSLFTGDNNPARYVYESAGFGIVRSFATMRKIIRKKEKDTMCIFCEIVAGNIPSNKVYEDDKILAFRDINPQAPTHIVVIPKEHIPDMNGINAENSGLIAHIFETVPKIAAEEGLKNGYRVISNCGPDACQSVKHIHFHILGGTQMADKMA